MALKSIIYKVRLDVSDLDRNLYDDFALSVARHPSETEARMMLRIAAFALNAGEHLEFGRGISTDDEPDLWRKDLTGAVELWIELGTPDPDRLRKACSKARQVVLYSYGERALAVWWEKHAQLLSRFNNLAVYSVSDDDCAKLAALALPRLELQCMVSEGDLMLTQGDRTIQVQPRLMPHPTD